jgi:uncharacterized protein
MRNSTRIQIMSIFFTICLLMATTGNAFSEEYMTLKGLKSVKAVFDFERGNPLSALQHLQVIHQTFKDRNIQKSGKKPQFTVIFIGPSVKLVSRNTDGFNAEDQRIMADYAKKLSEMANDGIKFEVCLVAVRGAGVEPSSILPEIKQVGNGWISLIGHQAKGYAIVPISP